MVIKKQIDGIEGVQGQKGTEIGLCKKIEKALFRHGVNVKKNCEMGRILWNRYNGLSETCTPMTRLALNLQRSAGLCHHPSV